MSKTIEERVVEMKFNNSQFQRGIQGTVGLLDMLKKKLNLDSATKSIQGLDAAGKKFSLAGMAEGIDGIAKKFSTLSIIGITALTNLVNRAVDAGLQFAKSFTVQPILDGFAEYELKMGSIQTILANTERHGTGLKDVTRNLDELNKYADKTIYNFGDMTRNIGLFTNAGIKIDDATSMIKGFSNSAAASGTSAQGAAGAAYQLSQALSAGTIRLMDWKSLTNVGMGNKNMQNSLIEIADSMGMFNSKTTTASAASKDFNGSLEKQWLSADVMSTYLKIMAEDNEKLNRAQLKSIGITGKQADAFIRQQKTAAEAATKIRTWSQLVGTVKEGIGSGWSETFDILLGDFNQATELFTGIYDAIDPLIGGFTKSRNELLNSWVKMGGRDALIGSFKNIFQALGSIIKPIKDAFRDIFPKTTALQLLTITKAIQDFTRKLILSKESSKNLGTFFKGIFSVLKIGIDIVKGLARMFFSFWGILGGGTGSILSLAGGVGDLLLKFTDWINKGDKVNQIFDSLINGRAALLQPLVAWVGKLVEAFGSLLRGNPGEFVDKLKESFSAFAPLVTAIQNKITSILSSIETAYSNAQKFGNDLAAQALGPIMRFFQMLSDGFTKIQDYFTLDFNFDTSSIKNATKDVSGLTSVGSNVSNIWEGVGKAFEKVGEIVEPIVTSIGDVLKTIVDKIRDYIKDLDMQDAVALINTGFFIAFYTMLRKFIKNLDGIVDDFSNMIGSITGIFDALTKTLETMQQNIRATIILKIAVAVGILAAAVWALSVIDTAQLVKALSALATIFILLTGTMLAMSKMSFSGQIGLTKATTSLILMAIAVRILADAVADLAVLDWGQLTRGLIGVGVLLAGLTLFSKFASANEGGLKSGAGLILLAVAIKILASAVETIGALDTGTLVKGMIALELMMAMLMSMVMVMNGTKGVFTAAAGLLILSVALATLAATLKFYSMFDFGTFAYGLGLMAAMLTAVGLAMRTMPKGMPAMATGLLILSAAMLVFAGVLKIFAGMDGEEIAKSLTTLAASLLILALGLKAIEYSPKGAAALVIVAGALMLMAGVLMVLSSLSWESLAIALVALAGTFVIIGAAGLLLAPAIPVFGGLALVLGALGLAMLTAGAGFFLFATGFATLAAAGTAGVAVLTAAFVGILSLIPLFMQQIGLGLIAFAKVISDAGPVLVKALVTILLSLLSAIDKVMPKFFDTMTRLILGLVNVVVKLIPKIIDAGLKLIFGFLAAINNNVYRIVTIALSIISNFLRGIADGIPRVVREALHVIRTFIKTISEEVPKLVDEGMKAIIKLVNGISDAIDNNSAALGRAGGRLAGSIIKGMVGGIWSGITEVANAARQIASNALDAAKNFLGINSPSKEFMKLGRWSSEGMAMGISKYSEVVETASEGVGHAAIDSMRKTIVGLSELVSQNVDANPVIAPVLDLTQIRKDAVKMGSLLTSEPITATATLKNAQAAYDDYSSGRPPEDGSSASGETPTNLNFTQNNYSPRELSASDLYRQTKNQISTAKGVLAKR